MNFVLDPRLFCVKSNTDPHFKQVFVDRIKTYYFNLCAYDFNNIMQIKMQNSRKWKTSTAQ